MEGKVIKTLEPVRPGLKSCFRLAVCLRCLSSSGLDF